MTPAEFKPDLLTSVKTYNTFNDPIKVPFTSVNPNICASQKCGVELAELYASYSPMVYMDTPQKLSPFGPFFQVDLVSWLRFPNGAVVNCGILASWWISSAPDTAFKYAESEIKGVISAKDAENQANQ